MPKKRKSEAAGLEEVERSLFSTFCTAANSISQLYSLAHNQQRAGFVAGERHALIRFQQWLEAGAQPGTTYISREKLLDFIQGELERLDEGWPANPPVQSSHGAAGGGTAVSSHLPPRHTHAPSGVAASNLLSQLHHCHIRPRTTYGEGMTVPAAPSGSSCWESPGVADSRYAQVPVSGLDERMPAGSMAASQYQSSPSAAAACRVHGPGVPGDHHLNRGAEAVTGGLSGTAQSLGNASPHVLHLKSQLRTSSPLHPGRPHQDQQQDSPLAGSGPTSVPPLEALDAATSRFPQTTFGSEGAPGPGLVVLTVQPDPDEHCVQGGNVTNGRLHLDGGHAPAQHGTADGGAFFGQFGFLDNDHQSEGGDTQMG